MGYEILDAVREIGSCAMSNPSRSILNTELPITLPYWVREMVVSRTGNGENETGIVSSWVNSVPAHALKA